MPFPFPFTTFGANRSSNSGGDTTCDFTYCYGGDWVQGKVGNYGIKMDGSGDLSSGEGYISVNNSSDVSALTDDFTVQAWIKFGDTRANNGTDEPQWSTTIATSNWTGAGPNWFVGWSLGRSGGAASHTNAKGRICFTVAGTGVAWDEAVSDDAGDAGVNIDGAWHHVVGKRESGTATLYIDGEAQATTTTTAPGDGGGLALGRLYQDVDDYYFSGSIDEVAVWDVPLTDAQISLLSTGSARADSITPPAASDGTWTTGKVGDYALELNGSIQNISVASTSEIPIGNTSDGDWSVSLWVYYDSMDAWDTLIGRYPSTWYQGWGITHDNSTSTQVGFWSGGFDGGEDTEWSHATVTTGQWYHMVGVFNSGTNRTRFWLNATASAAAISFYGGTTGAGSEDIGIGANSANTYFGIDGKMDDVAIWNVQLDQGAIEAIYNDGTGASASTVSASNITSHWKLDDGPPNSTAADSSPVYTNNGTINGGAGGGTTGSLLMYYDFEIGDSNPVSGNFPPNATVYDVVTASFHPSTAHTGTMTNMSVADFGAWGQGKIGKYCLDFDGTNDYVETANNSSLNYYNKASAFTATGWVKSSTSAFEYIWGKCKTSGDEEGWWSAFTNALIYFRVNDGVAGYATRLYAQGTGNASDGNWHHLAFVKTTGYSSVADLKIYLDGTSLSLSDAGSSAALSYGPSSSVGMRLGDMGFAVADSEFTGQIDEFSFWSGSLSQANITSLAAGAKANAITASSSDTGSWSTDVPTAPGGTYSLNFLNDNDLVSVSDNSTINFTGDFTVVAWTKSDSNSDLQGFISKCTSSPAHNGWLLGRDSTPTTVGHANKFLFSCRNSSYTYAYSNAVGTSDWTHLAGKISNGTAYLYVDSVQQSATDSVTLAATSVELRLGQWWSVDESYPLVDGNLDEVSIWSGSLSNAEISSLYGGTSALDLNPAPTTDSGSWAPGQIGNYSLDFDGTSDYTSTTSDSAFTFQDSDTFSVACWVSSSLNTPSSTELQGFVSKYSNAHPDHQGWIIGRVTNAGVSPNARPVADNSFCFSTRGTPGYNVTYIWSDTAIDDQWHHMVATRDGASGVKMYIDGVLQADTTPVGDGSLLLTDPGAALALGSWEQGSTSALLDGKLDEVGIWDVVLDAGAVDALHSGSLCSAVSSSALVLYYNMENGPGNSTLTDRSSTGADASFTGLDGGSVVTPTLAAYYTMENGPGNSTLTDRSTNTNNGTLESPMDPGSAPATLTAYYDMECDGPGSANLKDLSGNDLSGTLTNMSTGSCGSG